MSVRIDSAEGRWPMLYTRRVRRAVEKAFMARQAWRVDYEEVE